MGFKSLKRALSIYIINVRLILNENKYVLDFFISSLACCSHRWLEAERSVSTSLSFVNAWAVSALASTIFKYKEHHN